MAVNQAGEEGEPLGVDADGIRGHRDLVPGARLEDPPVLDQHGRVADRVTAGRIEEGVAEKGGDHARSLKATPPFTTSSTFSGRASRLRSVRGIAE